jgi:hypothetical protein
MRTMFEKWLHHFRAGREFSAATNLNRRGGIRQRMENVGGVAFKTDGFSKF